VDHHGNPVANAAISLKGKASEFRRIDPDNMTNLFAPFRLGINTDNQGTWQFTGAPEALENATLIVRDSNGAESRFSTGEFAINQRHYLHGDPMKLTELLSSSSQVSLIKGNDVTIQVTDQSGRPIANAQIEELFGTPIKHQGATGPTDKSGEITFLGRTKKELLYVASHPDYASASVVARPSDYKGPLKIILPDRQPISGFVVDSGGSPVSEALVSLHPYLNENFHSNWASVTGADGKFVWEEAPEVETFLQVQAADFKTVVIANSPTDNRPIRIPLPNSDTFKIKISARIIDARTEQPMNQFEYRLRRDHRSSRDGWTSGRNGLIEIQTTYKELTQKHLQSKGIFYQIEYRAIGYQANSSRRLSISEINPSLKTALQPILKQHDPHGVQVLAPDGTPVHKATIFLIGDSRQSKPHFNTLASRSPSMRGPTDYRFQTNSEGRFPAMPFPRGFRGVVVTSEQGVVALPSESLDLNSGSLQLKALGQSKEPCLSEVGHSPIARLPSWVANQILHFSIY